MTVRAAGVTLTFTGRDAAVPFSLGGVVVIVIPVTMTTDAHAGRLASGSK